MTDTKDIPPPQPHVMGGELNGVAKQLAEGSGVWLSCTGCHELNEGVPTGPYSSIMKCHLGMGCHECGGIGAIWDTTDYQAMGLALAAGGSEAAKTEALFSADAWLDRWATHVGSCRGGQVCTCGLTGVRFEVAVAIDADKNGEPIEATITPEQARNELARREDAGYDLRVPLTAPANVAKLTNEELRLIRSGSSTIKPSIDTMREAAKDLLVKNGWKPGNQLSGHSVAGLMAEFGIRVQAGDFGCDYPDCGCCADAACADAVKQHPDLGGTPAHRVVNIPTTADEAEAMEKIGFAYLREHAPDRLTPEGLARPVGNSVGIKPLEWRPGYCADQVKILQASTIGGLYQIRVLAGAYWLDFPEGTKACCGSEAEAKDAAQADHGRLIRSALTSAEVVG